MQSAREVQGVLSVLYNIAKENPDLEMTLSQSVSGGLMAGAGAVLGGLLGGKEGMLTGAAIGGVMGYLNAEDFKPVWKILQNMSDEERSRFAAAVKRECVEMGIRFLSDAIGRQTRSASRELLRRSMQRFGYK
ncbi:protein C19orf12 homolog [Corticium candelabrum]|uniref:protein C19orf12 homolog n=1 Tax=Corticium candelabrum TaxID=121492 RepID=UPI002E26103E|nr:protein C19orf12 homolog [Corticium candelabrum]